MTLEQFRKKPFTDRLKDTAFLLKNSFTVVTRDKDIKKPAIKMVILTTIITLCIYLGALLLFLGSIGLGFLLLMTTFFILIPFRFFFDVRQKADLSWLVYNTICGTNITLAQAHKHTGTFKGRLRLVAFVDLLVSYASSRGQGRGIMAVIMSIFLAFLRAVWNLLKHYLIPAIVIEQKPLKETVPKIKSLKDNVPATLTGVFGIDFVGNIVFSLFYGVFFLMMIFSAFIGWILAQFMEATVLTIAGFSFSWVPVIIMLFIVSVIGGAFKKLVQAIKIIYFSIFYTTIMQPMNIHESLREELTHYLLMRESDFNKKEPEDPHQKLINQLSEYITRYKGQGHSEQQLKEFLISQGYSEKDLNEALNKSK